MLSQNRITEYAFAFPAHLNILFQPGSSYRAYKSVITQLVLNDPWTPSADLRPSWKRKTNTSYNVSPNVDDAS